MLKCYCSSSYFENGIHCLVHFSRFISIIILYIYDRSQYFDVGVQLLT